MAETDEKKEELDCRTGAFIDLLGLIRDLSEDANEKIQSREAQLDGFNEQIMEKERLIVKLKSRYETLVTETTKKTERDFVFNQMKQNNAELESRCLSMQEQITNMSTEYE